MKVEMKVTFTVAEVENAMKDLYTAKFGPPPKGFRLVAVSDGYRPIPDITVETEELPDEMPEVPEAPAPVPFVSVPDSAPGGSF